MKHILSTIIVLIIFCNATFSQCPQRGLKVIGADCNPPKDLAVTSASCSLLNVKWKEDNSQFFIFNASYAVGDSIIEIKSAKVSCDSNGNCAAAVPVSVNMQVKWSVQAICSANNTTLYSKVANGPDAYIKPCGLNAHNTKTSNIHVYPNPATTYIIIAFGKAITGNIEFKIFDVTGKQVYDKPADDNTKLNNEYEIDLPNLAAGTYLIEVHHNGQVDETKFMIIKK